MCLEYIHPEIKNWILKTLLLGILGIKIILHKMKLALPTWISKIKTFCTYRTTLHRQIALLLWKELIHRTSLLSYKNIDRIRSCLFDGDAAIFIYAFITNKIDYCNSLLYGMPDNVINRLQKWLNIVARIFHHTIGFYPLWNGSGSPKLVTLTSMTDYYIQTS